ncbi:hypothetical protein, partial [Archangium sp.]|uniref:hypothetical protein n=1 Tax=Archangium sp. TaxID=1872627 RepID=UPI002D4E5347
MKTKHLVIGALGLALVAGLGLVALELAAPVVASGGTSSVARAPSTTAVRFPWAEGVRSVYALSWLSETGGLIAPTQTPAAGPQASPAGRTEKASVQAETEVEGEVVVEGLGRSGDGFLAAVSYGEIRRFAFRLQGHDAVEDEAAVARELTGHQAFVTFSPRGEAVAIAFAPRIPAATQTALRSLVAQLQWTLPPADAQEWSAVERDAVGKVRVAYRRAGNQLHRTPVAFESLDAVPGEALDGQQELQGDALLSVDEEGLSSINERLHVRYTRRGGKEPAVTAGWTFSLERLRQERFDAAAVRALAQEPARPFGPPVADAQLGARRDERLARNVTVDSIMLDVDHFEAGQKPAHDQVI